MVSGIVLTRKLQMATLLELQSQASPVKAQTSRAKSARLVRFTSGRTLQTKEHGWVEQPRWGSSFENDDVGALITRPLRSEFLGPVPEVRIEKVGVDAWKLTFHYQYDSFDAGVFKSPEAARTAASEMEARGDTSASGRSFHDPLNREKQAVFGVWKARVVGP